MSEDESFMYYPSKYTTKGKISFNIYKFLLYNYNVNKFVTSSIQK